MTRDVGGHVQMTSVRRGGRGVSKFLTIRGGGCVISILTILTGGGGGSKIPKIRLTSFVHGPLGMLLSHFWVPGFGLGSFDIADTLNAPLLKKHRHAINYGLTT